MEKNLDTNMYVYFGSEHYDRELLKNDKMNITDGQAHPIR